jgi:hypothetical protein
MYSPVSVDSAMLMSECGCKVSVGLLLGLHAVPYVAYSCIRYTDGCHTVCTRL